MEIHAGWRLGAAASPGNEAGVTRFIGSIFRYTPILWRSGVSLPDVYIGAEAGYSDPGHLVVGGIAESDRAGSSHYRGPRPALPVRLAGTEAGRGKSCSGQLSPSRGIAQSGQPRVSVDKTDSFRV